MCLRYSLLCAGLRDAHSLFSFFFFSFSAAILSCYLHASHECGGRIWLGACGGGFEWGELQLVEGIRGEKFNQRRHIRVFPLHAGAIFLLPSTDLLGPSTCAQRSCLPPVAHRVVCVSPHLGVCVCLCGRVSFGAVALRCINCCFFLRAFEFLFHVNG
jgi:hypothetical protein